MHGVHVDRVQFPAARKNANRKVKIMPIFNDLNLDNWKDSEILTDSLWIISERDKSGKHNGFYHGNFAPAICRYS